MSINRISPPYDEGDSSQCEKMSRSDREDRRRHRVARLRRDGRRDSALIKPFLTTPQSPAVTAPLTRGAENKLFRQTEAPAKQQVPVFEHRGSVICVTCVPQFYINIYRFLSLFICCRVLRIFVALYNMIIKCFSGGRH